MSKDSKEALSEGKVDSPVQETELESGAAVPAGSLTPAIISELSDQHPNGNTTAEVSPTSPLAEEAPIATDEELAGLPTAAAVVQGAQAAQQQETEEEEEKTQEDATGEETPVVPTRQITLDELPDYISEKREALDDTNLSASRISRRNLRSEILPAVVELIARTGDGLNEVLPMAETVLLTLNDHENDLLIRKPVGLNLRPETKTQKTIETALHAKLEACLVDNLTSDEEGTSTLEQDEAVQTAQRKPGNLDLNNLIMQILTQNHRLKRELGGRTGNCSRRPTEEPRINLFKQADHDAKAAAKAALSSTPSSSVSE